MNRIVSILSLLILLSIIACEKLMIEKDQENNHENNFELLWSTIDKKYSFFEFKNINWDSIRQEYRPKINNNLTNRQLFDIMADMLFELKDGHVNLYSDFDRSENWEWYSKYPSNFNSILVEFNYLGNDSVNIGPFTTNIIDSIGYIYLRSFSDKIKDRDADMIIERFSEMKGIILDVRNNSGGLSIGGKLLASRFADRKRRVSYILYKTGPGHGDFSEPQPNYISPEGKAQFTKTVVVLSNRRSYSATNDFVLNMSAFPHVTVMGDTTGGGGGTPYDYELLNGWRFRFPRTQTLATDGFNVEHGIPPSTQVNILERDLTRGIDTIIEAAIRHINASHLSHSHHN